jgi:hypothetical protein
MPPKDDRITMKFEKALWRRIESLVKSHPEWGIISVPDFVRRAVENEIRRRQEEGSNRVLTLCFSPESADKRRKAP